MPKVLTNTFWILFGSAFNKLSSIILLFILSRHLGAEGFGKFSFAFFYVALFSSIAELGLTPILIKHVNADPLNAGAVQKKGIAVGMASALSAVLLSWACAYWIGFEPDMLTLVVAASIGLVISFRDVTFRWVLEAPFRARLKMRAPVLLGVVSESVSFALVLAAVYSNAGLAAIAALYVLGNLPGFVALAALSAREIRPAGSGVSTKGLLREALPIGVSNLLNAFYLLSGSVVLYYYCGPAEVGYFALAFRVTTSLRIIPEAMMHSVYPFMAGSFNGSAKSIQGLFGKAIGFCALVSLPLAFGVMAGSGGIAVLFGGEQFRPSGAAFSILAWATAAAFFNTVLRASFNAAALQRYNMGISLAMAAASMALSLALVPRLGFAGAAYALAFTEAAGLVLCLACAYASGLRFPVGAVFKYFLAAIGMAACIWQLPHLMLQLAVGAVVYAAAGFALGGFREEEILRALGRG